MPSWLFWVAIAAIVVATWSMMIFATWAERKFVKLSPDISKTFIAGSGKYVLMAICAVVVLLWLFRFDVSATSNNSNASAYVIDRWNGTVSVCVVTSCYPTTSAAPR
jgi:hypothetical protein